VTRTLVAAMLLIATLVRITAAEPTDAGTEVAARQMLIAVRVLSYDKSLADRVRDTVVTIALVSSATPDGRSVRARFAAAFALMPKLKVGGKPVRVVTFDIALRKTLEPALAANRPRMVVVVDDLGDQLAVVSDIARARAILTVSLREADVARGISVGVVQAGERNEILINIEAARSQGVRFGAGLLQLARLVDGS
jgi:YfiR/HmsC-like